MKIGMFTQLLTRKDIVDRLVEEKFPPGEYWIAAGAGLVMHRVKSETRDIDMGCTTELADLLIQRGAKWRLLADGTRQIEMDNGIELFENWFADRIVEIDGLCVASVESIRKQKAALNRAKDRDDIALIDEFMNNANQGLK